MSGEYVSKELENFSSSYGGDPADFTVDYIWGTVVDVGDLVWSGINYNTWTLLATTMFVLVTFWVPFNRWVSRRSMGSARRVNRLTLANHDSASKGMQEANLSSASTLKMHDAVLDEWEQYRTDPTLIIENPAIADSQAHWFMLDFVDALEEARDLRPDDTDAVSSKETERYEKSVRNLRRVWGRAKSESKKHNLVGMTKADRKILRDARSFLSTFEGAQTEHERANAGRALYNLLERRFGPVIIAPGLDQLEQQIAGQIEA